MVENVRGQCGRAAVTRVASSRVELRACRVLACRGVHVVGVKPCAVPAPCSAHYGVCVPVVVSLTDAANGLGTVKPDEEAILKIVEANRRKHAAKRASASPNQEDKPVPERVAVAPPPLAAPFPAGQPAAPEDQPLGVDVEGIVEAVERWVRGPGEEEGVESAQQKEARKYKELVGTLAELAAEKRAGRVAPGPEPPTGGPPHHETVQLFSELMQTDDVSTIAAQIANQAELIYQTWKSTGLNPTELIRYHSVNKEAGSSSDVEPSTGGPPSATAKPRTPVRNISPAPPGSSPAISRKFIEPALHNGRPHASSPVRSLNTSPRPYIPPGSSPHSPSGQPQPPPVFPSSNGGPSPHQSPRQVYSSPTSPPSPSQTQGSSWLIATSASPQSPRSSLTQPPPPPERSSSYPGVDSTQQQQQEGPYDILGDPDLGASLQELVNSFVLEDKARHHAATVAALASQRPKSAPSSIQEALQRFERQMAITSRSAAHAPDQATSPPPPIGTMGRFAQMQLQQQQLQQQQLHQQQLQHQQLQQQQLHQQQLQQQQLGPSLGGSSSSSSVTINTAGRRYGGTRSDSAISPEWSRMQADHDARSRRSASPNPPISQPGWNEAPPPNTSTWPLKNKQPVVERKSSKHSVSSSGASSSSASSSAYSSSSSSGGSNVTTSTNYITTLEARVESSGQKYSGVPLRHKVVTMSAVDQEEERLMHALRTGTLIDDGDHLRPLHQARPMSLPCLVSPPQTSPINTTLLTSAAPTSETGQLSPNSRKAKYSISVTVDVDKPIEVTHQGTHQQHHLQQKIHQQQIQQQLLHQQQTQLLQQQQQQQLLQIQQQQMLKMGASRMAMKPGKEVDMSVVDFAKVRYQESQQHPPLVPATRRLPQHVPQTDRQRRRPRYDGKNALRERQWRPSGQHLAGLTGHPGGRGGLHPAGVLPPEAAQDEESRIPRAVRGGQHLGAAAPRADGPAEGTHQGALAVPHHRVQQRRRGHQALPHPGQRGREGAHL